MSDLLHYICKVCLKASYSAVALAKKVAKADKIHETRGRAKPPYRQPRLSKEVQFRYHLKANYNLSPVEYESALEFQKGECAICGVEEGRKLFIDHSHKSGEFRGLLCRGCNAGLGFFKDDPRTMKAAIKYIIEATVRLGEAA